MKKLIAGAILLGASSMAFAQPGCGVGAMIWKGQSGVAPHVLAATTNGTFGNQTFGMTSGTLGCEAAGGPLASGVDYFIDENLDMIAMESATGEGETIDALAEMIGVQDADKRAFRLSLQGNFDTLFPSDETSSAQVYDAIVDVMAHNARLAKYLG